MPSMTLYITKDNQEKLREHAEGVELSMSGLINKLLADYFKAEGQGKQ